MKTKRTLLICFVAVVTACTGCRTKEPRGHVYREWSRRIAQMGIFPVYPPREDIVVGDVYALPLHPYDSGAVEEIGGLGNAGIRVAYLGDTNVGWGSLLNVMSNYYSSRPYPADSQAAALGVDPATVRRMSGFDDKTLRTSAFGNGSTARLRQVAFPDFAVTTVDESAMAAVLPIEGIMAGLNFNRSKVKAVTVKIPHAESYGLTTEQLLNDIYGDHLIRVFTNGVYFDASTNSVIDVAGARLAYAMFRDILHQAVKNPKLSAAARARLLSSAAEMKDTIHLALVSEVYFARTMDITVDYKTGWGAGAAARPIGADDLAKLKDLGLLETRLRTNSVPVLTNAVSNGKTNTVVGTKAEVVEVTAADTAYDIARKLRGVDVKTGVENIGGSVKVLSVSTSSVGMRCTFERPICLGVRGVIIKLNVRNVIQDGGTNYLQIVDADPLAR